MEKKNHPEATEHESAGRKEARVVFSLQFQICPLERALLLAVALQHRDQIPKLDARARLLVLAEIAVASSMGEMMDAGGGAAGNGRFGGALSVGGEPRQHRCSTFCGWRRRVLVHPSELLSEGAAEPEGHAHGFIGFGMLLRFGGLGLGLPFLFLFARLLRFHHIRGPFTQKAGCTRGGIPQRCRPRPIILASNSIGGCTASTLGMSRFLRAPIG